MESIFLTNRVIRNYLQLFNENKWKEVIKHTLIYGIQSLQYHYQPLTQLSPQRLEEIIMHSNFILTAEDHFDPELSRLRALKANADYLSHEMGIDPSAHYHTEFPDYPQRGNYGPASQNYEEPAPQQDNGDDEFDEVVKVNMGPSGNTTSSAARRNNRNNRNNRKVSYQDTNFNNHNNNNNNNHIFGEYVPTNAFNKQKNSFMEYLDKPAPIKSQVNPLDPDGGVHPEWFVQHEAIPPVAPLHPPRKPHNAPTNAKPPHGKHGARPKNPKPKTNITETNVYYGKRSEPVRHAPPPAAATRTRRTPIKAESRIKSQVDADREAYKNHKARKTPAQIADEFYEGDMMERFSDSQPYDEFEEQPYEEEQYNSNTNAENLNPNVQEEEAYEEPIPAELTRTFRPRAPVSQSSTYPPNSSSSPHIQIHAPGAQIYTSQPPADRQPATQPAQPTHPSHPSPPQSHQAPSPSTQSPQLSHSGNIVQQPPHPSYKQSPPTQPQPTLPPTFPPTQPTYSPPVDQFTQQSYVPPTNPAYSQHPHYPAQVSATYPQPSAPPAPSPPLAPSAPPAPSAPAAHQPTYTQDSSPSNAPPFYAQTPATPYNPNQYTPQPQPQPQPQQPLPQQPTYPQSSHPQPPQPQQTQPAQALSQGATPSTNRSSSPYTGNSQATQTQPSQSTQTYEQPTAQTLSHQATQTPVHQPTQTDPVSTPMPAQQQEKTSFFSPSATATKPPSPTDTDNKRPVPAGLNFQTPGPVHFAEPFPSVSNSAARMGWSYHSEPTPYASNPRKPVNDTPFSFPLTAPPTQHHTSSHYEPVLSSPDNSPPSSAENSPHTSPDTSRSSTPSLTQTHPVPKTRHTQSDLYQTQIPTKPRHHTNVRAHQSSFNPFSSTAPHPSSSVRPRPPSPTLSHSSVEWVTLEGETEASDTSSQAHGNHDISREYNLMHGVPFTAGAGVGVGVEADGADYSRASDAEDIEDEEGEETNHGVSERGSPPIIHMHTHRHFIYPSDKLKHKGKQSDLQGWDFDRITSQPDADQKERRVKAKKSSARRHSKAKQDTAATPVAATPTVLRTSPFAVATDPAVPLSTPSAHVAFSSSTKSTRTQTRSRVVEEMGVGDTDINIDVEEDFERGLDMWKGNTMEIAARLRRAEQERKELQRQLLNASHSSKSNSSK